MPRSKFKTSIEIPIYLRDQLETFAKRTRSSMTQCAENAIRAHIERVAPDSIKASMSLYAQAAGEADLEKRHCEEIKQRILKVRGVVKEEFLPAMATFRNMSFVRPGFPLLLWETDNGAIMYSTSLPQGAVGSPFLLALLSVLSHGMTTLRAYSNPVARETGWDIMMESGTRLGRIRLVALIDLEESLDWIDTRLTDLTGRVD